MPQGNPEPRDQPLLANGGWDGETALSRNGMRSDMSDGIRDQMRLMVAQGHWGEVKLKTQERWRRR
jgi:hypothetical protein